MVYSAPMPRGSVTLRDVATRAGVSATTASSALRGAGRMRPDLRAHIQSVADSMGYQIDPIISAGMSQMRSRADKRTDSALAWLEATVRRDELEHNPAFRLSWKGADAQARDLGYNLERFWLYEPDVTPERLARIFRARGIKGVVVLQHYQRPELDAAPLIDFDFTGLSCVSVTTRMSKPEFSFAQSDHFACAELALSELYALGYRRIGLMCPPSIDALTQHRVYSAYTGFVSRRTDMEKVPVFVTEGEPEQKAMLAWLKKEKPEVVLGWKPTREFESLGFKVPEDFGVCLLDYFPEYGDTAGIDQNHSEIGAAAVRLVHAQLQQGLRGTPRCAIATMVEGHWLQGSSVRPMP